jgi:DNA polymerase III delta prime subunit
MTTPWNIKYAPRTFDGMVLHPRTRSKLKSVMRDCPHVILCGDPGMGKTTFTNIFLKKLEHVYISGKSGTEVVRDKVKSFVAIGNESTFCESDSPPASVKYCIINEADWLSNDSQAELRMVMEDFEHATRFAFITNEVAKLQAEINSRCVEVEFEKADINDVMEFVRKILLAENVSDNHLENRVSRIWQHHQGDIRKVVKEIQASVVEVKA